MNNLLKLNCSGCSVPENIPNFENLLKLNC